MSATKLEKAVPAIARIDTLMQKAQASGLLWLDGRVVREWRYGGPPETRFDVMSIGKTLTGLALGLALEDGLIAGLDQRVKEAWPDFEAGPFSAQITFRHLATMSSGIPARLPVEKASYKLACQLLPPGTALVYHNDQVCHLARALTYVFDRPLIEVLQARIFEPLGVQPEWRANRDWPEIAGRSGKPHPLFSSNAGCVWWTPDELLKVARLFLDGGRHDGRQILSRDFVDASWTPCGRLDLRPPHWGEGYGLYWWALLPGVWYMSGLGGQFALVWPRHRAAMVKLNSNSPEHVRRDGRYHVGVREIFPLLSEHLEGMPFEKPRVWDAAARMQPTEFGVHVDRGAEP